MLTRTLVVTVDEGTKEDAWNRVTDAVADAEASGALAEAVLDALGLPLDLADLVTVRVA